MENISIKQIFIVVLVFIAVGVTALLSGSLVETNNEGYYHVRQSVLGNMSVRDKAGTYFQALDKITIYEVCDTVYFSKSKLDGGSGEQADAITVRFNDGGTAEISGMLKFCAPQSEDKRLILHKEYKSQSAIKYDLVRQSIIGALKQTATLMKAESSYSTKRSEFVSRSKEQIKDGIYATISRERVFKDADGNELTETINELKLDKNGNPIVSEISPLKTYGIRIAQFTIKDMDFDETIDALIAKKKEAQQMKVVAKANAEKAKQDAITAMEQGKAKIAEAKAEEEVAKITEVTRAQKELEVAKLNAQRVDADTKAMLIRKKREAEANKLLVSAGLTPKEKAEYKMNTSIGVAKELSSIKLPKLMIFGGEGKSGPTDPFQAVGLESFMKITDKLTDSE